MKSASFDKVIVSSDDSENFLNFWPIVCKAWTKYFGVVPTLAFVSNRKENDPLILKLKTFGEVVVVPEIQGIPCENQAKIARFLVASMFEDKVCTIEDIDTIPLNYEYVESRLRRRPKNKILAVGREVLENTPHHGKFPISHITAEGFKFKQLFNPNSLSYTDAVRSFVGIRFFDFKEDILNHPSNFSDESLIRALIYANNLQESIFDVRRDVDIKNDWIDRSWWNVDSQKLSNGSYVCCNFLRPFKNNIHNFTEIIKNVYGYTPEIQELIVL